MTTQLLGFFCVFIGIVGQLNQFFFLPILSSDLSVFVFELKREDVEGMSQLKKRDKKEARKKERSKQERKKERKKLAYSKHL